MLSVIETGAVMDASKVSSFGEDPMIVRQAFAHFPSGVSVLAAEIDGEKHALVASSFMVGVSMEPCLVAVAVQKTSETWGYLRNARSIGVSIFGKGQADLTRKLAGRDRLARFEGVGIEVSDTGSVLINDAAVWFECSIYNASEAGDHCMVLLEVNKLGVGTSEPLIWHGAAFRELEA